MLQELDGRGIEAARVSGLELYRIRVLEVTREDYGVREVGEYRAVITN